MKRLILDTESKYLAGIDGNVTHYADDPRKSTDAVKKDSLFKTINLMTIFVADVFERKFLDY